MPNHDYQFKWRTGSRGTVVNTQYGQVVYRGQVDYSMTEGRCFKLGSGNADWKARLERGEPVGSAYSRVAYMNILGMPALSYSLSYSGLDWSVAAWGEVTSPHRFNPDVQMTESERMATQFSASLSYYDELAKGIGQFEGLTFLGEFPMLVSSLANRARALAEAQEYYSRKCLRHLRKSWQRYGRLKRPLTNKEKIRLKTSLSGYYLEYWFGIYPALKSLESLEQAFTSLPQTQYLAVSGKAHNLRKDVETVIVGASGNDTQIQGVFKTRNWYGCNIKGFYKTDSLYNLNLALGFTLDDLAVAGWELTPFSWLVDYWLPIGDFLNGRKYASLQPAKVYTTYMIRRTQWLSHGRVVKVGSKPATYSYSLVNPRGRDVSIRIDRQVGSNPPPLNAKCLLDMSTWGNGPSAQQWSYVSAVAATMTRRFRRLTKLL